MKNIFFLTLLLTSCVHSTKLKKDIVGKWFAVSIPDEKKDFIINDENVRKDIIIHNGKNGQIEISFNFDSKGNVIIKQGESIKKDQFKITDSLLVFPNRSYIITSISNDTMKLLDYKNNLEKNFYFYLKEK